MSRVNLRLAVAWVLIALNVVAIVVIVIFADGLTGVGGAVLLASFVLPGGYLTLKLPYNPLAWLLLIIGTSWSGAFVTPFDGNWVIPLGLMGTQLLLRFPNGALLPSAWWKRFSTASFCYLLVLAFAVTTGGAVAEDGSTNAFYLPWMSWATILILFLPLVIGVSVFSLVLRFRRATSVEREQIRWIAWAATTIGVIYTITLMASIPYDWGGPTRHRCSLRFRIWRCSRSACCHCRSVWPCSSTGSTTSTGSSRGPPRTVSSPACWRRPTASS
jgi:hypothetical protein